MITSQTVPMEWLDAHTNDPRWHYRGLVLNGVEIGHVEWFAESATAYAHGPDGRLGAFPSVEGAMRAVERATVKSESGILRFAHQLAAPTYSRESPPPYPDVPSDAARELCIDAFRRLLDGQLSEGEYNRVIVSAHRQSKLSGSVTPTSIQDTP